MKKMKKEAASAVRVSHFKSTIKSDSPEKLKEEIASFALRTGFTLRKDLCFQFTESATGELEMQPMLKAIEAIRKTKEKPKYFIVPFIERFTRGGALVYGWLRKELMGMGVMLVDTRGTISTEVKNMLEEYNVEYSWSKVIPSWTAELLEAEEARNDFIRTQVKLLGAQIRYNRMGYWVKGCPLGFSIERIYTENGYRQLLKPHPDKSKWFVRFSETAV